MSGILENPCVSVFAHGGAMPIVLYGYDNIAGLKASYDKGTMSRR